MAVKKRPVSPRQKMINLMYVVLMAMLALNVSSDVLNGFSLVDKSLQTTTNNATQVNQGIYDDFEEQMKANPKKVKEWYDKAQQVRKMSDSLFNFAEELKELIVKRSDGEDGDVHDIKNREDLEAATSVMLAPGTGRGTALFKGINSYRDQIIKMVTDSAQRRIIANNLNTEVPKNVRSLGKNWQEYSLNLCLRLLPSRYSPSCKAMCAMLKARCSTDWPLISVSRISASMNLTPM